MRILFYILLILFCATGVSYAQNEDVKGTFDYSDKRTFNIAKITIEGAESRDRNAIKSIAGLREGKSITIPGDDIPKAIKALWKLQLFEDVQILQEKVEADLIYLKIILVERATLSRYSITGENKNKHQDLTEIIDKIIKKGSIVTEDIKSLAKVKLAEYYIDKGNYDAKIEIEEVEDNVKPNSVRLVFDIDKGDRVKIGNINIIGNRRFPDSKLLRKLKNTKVKGTLLKKSKFVQETYKEDKRALIDFYFTSGYRDATILRDSVWRDYNGDLQIVIEITEGDQYYFRNISWKGNSKYTDEQLSNVLGINKGDIYNPELLEKRLSFSIDGRDVSSLYLDDGYLFFSIDPVETAIVGDSIDMEMQIYEGAQATIDKVEIEGNDRTHEHVIRRELRTKPGSKFSRTNIMRSQRSIMNLGYFNPETMNIETPINQQNGTVDIIYQLEERPSDQLELSAGYGGGTSGLIGTLGVTFNNFSIANIKDRSTWSPLPQGDGQKLSLRAQSNSRFFRSYNFSFTEPWLGGKRPTSFTVGAVHSAFDREFFGQGSLNITRGFVGIGSQLKWPDDFFAINSTLTLETIKLKDYDFGQFFVELDDGRLINIDNGNFKNFSINQTFSRSSVADPIFPRRGSRVSLSIQFTPPYSLFREDNYWLLDESEKGMLIDAANRERGPGNPLSPTEEDNLILTEENARKFEWLEYHKWRFNAEWYYNIFDKLVIMTNIKLGFLGAYNGDIGIAPFERFEVGGDGLSNQNVGITGKDIISLRGYGVQDNNVDDRGSSINARGGGAVFDKFTMELRYPLSLNPNSSIYVHGFIQGGNAWENFKEFNPFELNRSAGFGVRVFLPMFGLLGFDYGWGFDRPGGGTQFNIVLGFEPE
ncbi:MAG: outer membrane protein assembly factor BamA [Saprospiraceae bacterium]|nr:outer membrane protein assembly factor BamA [Saprospiraceae bacterium]